MDDFDVSATTSNIFDSLIRGVSQALPGLLGVPPGAPTHPVYAPVFSLTNPATWSPIHYVLIGGAAYLLLSRK